MNTTAITNWMRQTSTIAGISTILGAIAACLQGEMTWNAAIPLFVGAVIAMLLPGHGAPQAVTVQGGQTTVQTDMTVVRPQDGATTTIRDASAPAKLTEADDPNRTSRM